MFNFDHEEIQRNLARDLAKLQQTIREIFEQRAERSQSESGDDLLKFGNATSEGMKKVGLAAVSEATQLRDAAARPENRHVARTLAHRANEAHVKAQITTALMGVNSN